MKLLLIIIAKVFCLFVCFVFFLSKKKEVGTCKDYECEEGSS